MKRFKQFAQSGCATALTGLVFAAWVPDAQAQVSGNKTQQKIDKAEKNLASQDQSLLPTIRSNPQHLPRHQPLNRRLRLPKTESTEH